MNMEYMAEINKNGNWQITEEQDDEIYKVRIYDTAGRFERVYNITGDTAGKLEIIHTPDKIIIKSIIYPKRYLSGITYIQFTNDNTSYTRSCTLDKKGDSTLYEEVTNTKKYSSLFERTYLIKKTTYDNGKITSSTTQSIEKVVRDTLICGSHQDSLMKFVPLEKDSVGNYLKVLALRYEGNGQPEATIQRFAYEYY